VGARDEHPPGETISYYEQGKLVPSLKTLQRLMKALGYPLAAVEKTEGFLLDLGSPAFWASLAASFLTRPWGRDALEREIEAVAQERGRLEVRRARLELSLLAAWPGAERPGRPDPAEEEPEEATS
jgi:transcriptional regulator with XRE-family HTH domain